MDASRIRTAAITKAIMLTVEGSACRAVIASWISGVSAAAAVATAVIAGFAL